MAFKPTKAQELAINTRDRSILLSAAAGSGKTATLTARIIASLTDPVSPIELSNMLIVTFTRAAASEMRERISKALNDALSNDPSNDFLNRQTVMIASADICTIDSFCLNTVESNFEKAVFADGSPLPPDFRLADETELKTLSIEVMNGVIEKWYDKESTDVNFPKFIENFSNTRGEGSLIDSLLKCVSTLESVSDPDAYLKNLHETVLAEANEDFLSTCFGKMLKEFTEESLKYYISALNDLILKVGENDKFTANYLPAIENDISTCKKLISALNVSYADAKKVLADYSPEDMKALGKSKTELTDACKLMRDTVKKELVGLKDKYFSFPAKSIPEISVRLSGELKTLAAIISDYNQEYTKEKSIRRICSFYDIKRLAHKLLVNPDGTPTDIAMSMRSRYKAVYIDEYQDVDPVQNEIFNAVSAPGTRFTVGDIKQSIYSFRGAEPSIFGNMRKSIPNFGTKSSDEQLACSLFMSENFRCDKPVIDFVNLVSAHTLVPVKGNVAYRKEDDLGYAKSDGVGETPVKFCVFTSKDDESNAEIKYIANEIAHLLKNGKNNNGNQIKASDIAVLSRDNKFLDLVSEALSEKGIESSNAAAQDYFDNPEILLVLSLITAIDNPHKDIPLASSMCSPFFSFTLDELIKIRKGFDTSYSLYDAVESYADSFSDPLGEKCKKFAEELEALRNDAVALPVDKFIARLYKRFRVTSLVSEDTSRHQSQITANINRFYEYARGYAKAQHGGLNGFVSYINNFLEAGSKVDAPTTASAENAVVLMNIHKSKGLEFPVVFVSNCGKLFNRTFRNNSLVFDSELGVALKPGDETGFARIEPPQRAVLTLAMMRKQNEEEMRILYVALTRAREKLYVTAKAPTTFEKQLLSYRYLRDYECRSSVLSASSYLDWMKNAVCTPFSFFELHVDPTPPYEEETQKNVSENISTERTDEQISSIRRILAERFDYKYPYESAKKLPSKLSVSKLYPDILDDDGASGIDSDNLPELREKPLFMMEKSKESHVTAAERGTASHVFMQFCDFERAERSVRDELHRLVSERFIPTGTAELVNIYQLEKFFKSAFYKTVKGAKRLLREQRFNLFLPASEFTSSDELKKDFSNEMLMVQGVIDLVIEDANGNLILCDYKTDYLTKNELSDEALAIKKLTERHSEQLKYYSAAVDRLFGRVPDRVCIYSLPLGKAVDIIL